MTLMDLILSGGVSVSSFDGHCVRIDFSSREDAEALFELLSDPPASFTAIAAGSREGRDVKQARCEASQSGGESRIAQDTVPGSDMGKGE